VLEELLDWATRGQYDGLAAMLLEEDINEKYSDRGLARVFLRAAECKKGMLMIQKLSKAFAK
jgi:hypothetical protein